MRRTEQLQGLRMLKLRDVLSRRLAPAWAWPSEGVGLA